ncbi:CsgG/HfaB family protein [Piscirickettsia litoralis]|uniref:Curli production assembly/transport component CsgG n=1 Tax=Piscirickettsia litoralis TaxID=1891921 RepID=A0ABX3A2H3_9GAMM|nr:CsgG/HfaB family protein [Piscirickettsia litoralis]ODN42705.1 penicillin-binding protein activator LpoB [Piscirickettsia litoralis]
MRQFKLLLIILMTLPMMIFAQNSMPTIAVLKFNVNKEALVLYWQNHKVKHKDGVSGDVTVRDRGQLAVVPEEYSAMTNMLTDGLINTLVSSHKFKVLTRDRVTSVINEQKFAESGYVSPEQAVKTGKLLGADYLVTGSIQMLETKMRREKIPYTHEVKRQRYGLLVANIQVIDAHTGQIVAAYPVQVSKTQNIEKSQWQQDNEILRSRGYFLQQLKDKTTQVAANKILLTVFPLNIIKVTGDHVYINRGVGANFKVGDELAVFKQGQRLTDNQTGQFLGYTESSIGKVRIEAIEPKFAKAVIISGNSQQMVDAVVKALAKKKVPTPQGGGLENTPGSSASPLQW